MELRQSTRHNTSEYKHIQLVHCQSKQSLHQLTLLILEHFRYFLDGASDITFVLSQSETPYWQNPPTAVAMKIHDSANIRSYGAAYECWFHGVEASLLEVVGSSSTFLYLPNTKNASHILSGDVEVLARYLKLRAACADLEDLEATEAPAQDVDRIGVGMIALQSDLLGPLRKRNQAQTEEA